MNVKGQNMLKEKTLMTSLMRYMEIDLLHVCLVLLLNHVALSRIDNQFFGASFALCPQSLTVTCLCSSPAILSLANVIYWRLLEFYLVQPLLAKHFLHSMLTLWAQMLLLVNSIVWGRCSTSTELVLHSDERTCVLSICSGFYSHTHGYLQCSCFQVVTSKVYHLLHHLLLQM